MKRVFSIDEVYLEKSERMLRPELPVGHKGYTRVRRGKLESIKQKGSAKTASKKSEFFSTLVGEQLRNARNMIINKYKSELNSIGVVDVRVNDPGYGGTDLHNLGMTGIYNSKPVSIGFSHHGNTIYFTFMGSEESAMSATSMKNKMDAKLKKENE